MKSDFNSKTLINSFSETYEVLSINCRGIELDFEKSKEEKIKPAINVMTLRKI